jgi:hypothetical protein
MSTPAWRAANQEKMRAYRRQHYRDNKEAYKERAVRCKAEMREWLQQQKSVPCADCGVSYPYYVMDFDHVDGAKVNDVSALVNLGSWRNLRAEVAKCVVVCSNCHRVRTHERLQS